MPLRCGSFRDCWATNCPYPPHTDCWWARRDSNSQTRRKPVSKTGVYPNSTTRPWSTEPDSNWLRAGLQAAASTASAFSANEKLFLRGKNNY